jgi:hypothetical protein
MNALEEKILERVRQLDEANQRRVLEFAESIGASLEQPLSARDLMRLPAAERNRLARAALERSQAEAVELFEAYGEDDLQDE